MPSSACKTCARSEEHTSELQSHDNLVCRLLLEKKTTTRRDRAHAGVALTGRPGAHASRAQPSARRSTRPRAGSVRPLARTVAPFFFFFNDTAPTEISPLSLHDALPICQPASTGLLRPRAASATASAACCGEVTADRKSTRLNSSHTIISYAVFCLK